MGERESVQERAVCTVTTICVYEILWTIEELGKIAGNTGAPQFAFVTLALFPRKVGKDIKPHLLGELCLSQGKFASLYLS